MENSKVCSILGSIYSRLHDCKCISDEQFELCNNGSLADINRTELECIVKELFKEHNRLTCLKNDVFNLTSSVESFPFLFD